MQNSQIELNPRVCGGKPVIRGTRIPVVVILDELAGGASWEELLADWPQLKRDDITAALEYAKTAIEHTDISSWAV